MSKKRKHHEEEHENLERWLVSYADFITLLFAFFVTMYAISRVDEAKLGSAVESLQRALGSLIPIQMPARDAGVLEFQPSPIDPAAVTLVKATGEGTKTPETEQFEKIAMEIQQEVAQILGAKENQKGTPLDQIKYIIDKRGLTIRVPESFFFKSGQASIRPEILPVLDGVARSLEKIPNHIRIEGHTDSVPINTFLFPSNWELSTARATTIVRYFLAHYNFDPSRLSAAGFAEYRPIAPNHTPEGRMQNRRVDIVVLSSKEGEMEPQEGKASKRNSV
jgi:chemotaxis protein MotB